jgi:hypothetical protein
VPGDVEDIAGTERVTDAERLTDTERLTDAEWKPDVARYRSDADAGAH